MPWKQLKKGRKKNPCPAPPMGQKTMEYWQGKSARGSSKQIIKFKTFCPLKTYSNWVIKWLPSYYAGWQNLCEGKKGLRRQVWSRTKILSPNVRYFDAILRFVTIYALFGNHWTKKFLWVKTVFLGQEIFQICNYAQKRRIFRKNSKYVLDKYCMAIFALAERKAAHFCHPVIWWYYKFYKSFFLMMFHF